MPKVRIEYVLWNAPTKKEGGYILGYFRTEGEAVSYAMHEYDVNFATALSHIERVEIEVEELDDGPGQGVSVSENPS